VSARAIGVASCFASGRDGSNYAVTLFGKPPRVLNCDCERSNEPSLLQTVYLRNDAEMFSLITRRNGWWFQAMQALGQTAGTVAPTSAPKNDTGDLKNQIRYQEREL